MFNSRYWSPAILTLTCLSVAGCNPELWENNKHLQPLSHEIKGKIKKIGSSENAPLYIRIFKEEAVLEAWKKKPDGTYALLKTYPICAYSGKTGPKKKEGDRQAPEGFYSITPGQMNPNSSYHLSFNLGYPNAFDRSYGRTGAHLMVHGSCSSRGCYAMEDEPIAEIYALGREAFEGGQRAFKVHAFPFRMTPENMARNRKSEHFAFWQNLKNGYDHFEITGKPPRVEVCNRTYVFNPEGDGRFNASTPCPEFTIEPTLLTALTTRRAQENVRFQETVAKLEQEASEQSQAKEAAMVAAQNNLLTRKDRIAEGKDPDGFLAGLVKSAVPGGQARQSAATQQPSQAVTTNAKSAAESLANAGKQTNSGSGGLFSRLTSAIPNPFAKQTTPEAPPPPPVDGLPKARQ